MRKAFSLLTILVLLLGLYGCNSSSVDDNDNPIIETPGPVEETPKPVIVTPKKIADISVENVESESLYRFFFAFLNESEERMAFDATVIIRIVNDSNATVYNKTINITKSNFSNWTWTYLGQKTTKYLAAINIPYSEIAVGLSTGGTLYYQVTASNNTRWNELSLKIDDLPIQFSISLPSLPLNINKYGSLSGSKMYSTTVTEITYSYSISYDGTITLSLFFTGSKTYDWDGANTSRTMGFSYKIYDSEDYVVEDGTFYTPSLKVGEKYRNVESKVYGLTPGSFRIVIIANQS